MLKNAAKPTIPVQNFLLSSLPIDEFDNIHPHLKPVKLEAGTVYAEYGSRLDHCYFPNNGMVSLLSVTESGDTCEVGYVGYEGVVGMPAIFGKNAMPYQALVQVSSDGFTAPVQAVSGLFYNNREFHDRSLAFASVLLRQFAQTSACNRFHSILERMCRWFSIMCERSGNDQLALTQEFLAYMLGVQRTSVGQTAAWLQNKGVITYSRGKIKVIDLKRLNGFSCECLATINDELSDFLKKIPAPMSSIRQTGRLS